MFQLIGCPLTCLPKTQPQLQCTLSSTCRAFNHSKEPSASVYGHAPEGAGTLYVRMNGTHGDCRILTGQYCLVQVLEGDAADMAADAPKLEARAVQLTEQLQGEEKVRR